MLQLRRCKTQQITDSLDITEVSEKTETGQSQDKETYDLCQTIFLKKKKSSKLKTCFRFKLYVM